MLADYLLDSFWALSVVSFCGIMEAEKHCSTSVINACKWTLMLFAVLFMPCVLFGTISGLKVDYVTKLCKARIQDVP